MTPCIEHQGCVLNSGYGQVKEEGPLWLAHRLAWTKAKGPIPKGLLVCHRCDNRKCIRVSHLFLGTHRDNVIDMYRKGRGPNNKGTAHGRSKLTNAQVKEIRGSKASNKALAEKCWVSASTISRVRAERSYRPSSSAHARAEGLLEGASARKV